VIVLPPAAAGVATTSAASTTVGAASMPQPPPPPQQQQQQQLPLAQRLRVSWVLQADEHNGATDGVTAAPGLVASANRTVFFAKVPPNALGSDVEGLFGSFGKLSEVNLFRAWAGAKHSKVRVPHGPRARLHACVRACVRACVGCQLCVAAAPRMQGWHAQRPACALRRAHAHAHARDRRAAVSSRTPTASTQAPRSRSCTASLYSPAATAPWWWSGSTLRSSAPCVSDCACVAACVCVCGCVCVCVCGCVCVCVCGASTPERWCLRCVAGSCTLCRLRCLRSLAIARLPPLVCDHPRPPQPSRQAWRSHPLAPRQTRTSCCCPTSPRPSAKTLWLACWPGLGGWCSWAWHQTWLG
jgi:hypothetical protein